MESLHRFALRVFRRLPTYWRRRVVRTIAPSYTVGTMAFIHRPDGALLLVRLAYRDGWGVPGGLLQRGEAPVDGLRREVLEETGMTLRDTVGPVVQVAPEPQRVDLVFRASVGNDADASPRSPEIVEVGWFGPDALPAVHEETAGAMRLLEALD